MTGYVLGFLLFCWVVGWACTHLMSEADLGAREAVRNRKRASAEVRAIADGKNPYGDWWTF